MRLATLVVAAVLAVGVLWLAGEQHRKNCVNSGNTGCSVLPWVNGDRVNDAVQPVRPEDMTRRACILYNAGLRQGGVPASSGEFLDCQRSPPR